MTGIEELGLVTAVGAAGAGGGGAAAGGSGLGLGSLGALGSLAGGGAAVATALASKTPKLQPTVPMPDPNDPVALEARRRRLEEASATRGRESTILDNSVPTYVNSSLGL